MSKHDPAVNEVIHEMARVTAKYLNNEEVQVLINQWQSFEQVSVKMMQKSMLDIMRLYPRLKPHKYKIRRQFWQIVQSKIDLSSNTVEIDNPTADDKTQASIVQDTPQVYEPQQVPAQNKRTLAENIGTSAKIASTTHKSQQLATSETVDAFYTVIETIKGQLNEREIQDVFAKLHHYSKKERTLKGQSINMMQFSSPELPEVPDDVKVLNNLVQLTYACLCDVVGPSEADDVLYRSAEGAKQYHDKTLVERLF